MTNEQDAALPSPTAPPCADGSEVWRYLNTLLGGKPGLLNIWTVPTRESGQFFPADPYGISAATDAVLALDAQGEVGIYARMTTLTAVPESGRGGVDLSSHFLGFWTDLDFASTGHKGKGLPPSREAAQAVYDATGLPPASILVMSGGGLYHQVLLDVPLDITDPAIRAEVSDQSRRWQAVVERRAQKMGFSYGRGVGDLARVLRVPGTVNRKDPSDPRMATATYTDKRYSFKELCSALEAAERRLNTEDERATGGKYVAPGKRSERPSNRDGGNAFNGHPASPESARERLDQLLTEFSSVPEGGNHEYDGRNHALNKLAGFAYQYAYAGQLDPDLVTDLFRKAALDPEAENSGLEPFEVDATLRSAQRYGESNPRPWEAPGPTTGRTDTPGSGPDQSATDDDATEGGRQRGLLPEFFWEARPELSHIRTAAHARCCSGDVALYAVLTRLSGMISHWIRADTGIGSRASLNLFTAIVGPSGAGKSTGKEVADSLLQLPLGRDFRDGMPLGSGEGIAEVFMGEAEELTGEVHQSGSKRGMPVTRTVRKQVRHNAFFYADEGEVLTKLGSRTAATLGETLRRAAGGETLGQTNADSLKSRYIPAGSYSLGLAVGFQPETALPLLEDAHTGTPQRFLWCSATDPSIPEDPPEWPGVIDGGPQHKEPKGPLDITFPPEIKAELRRGRLAKARGDVEVHQLDAHEPLTRVKLSSLLALLDGREYVNAEDWTLSLTMWETSCALRNQLVERAKRAQAEETEQRTRARVEQETRVHAAKQTADRTVERVARNIAKKVHAASGGLTLAEANRALASRDRSFFSTALEYAGAKGWIEEADDRLQPGGSVPA
jgi:hypothetical protein